MLTKQAEPDDKQEADCQQVQVVTAKAQIRHKTATAGRKARE